MFYLKYLLFIRLQKVLWWFVVLDSLDQPLYLPSLHPVQPHNLNLNLQTRAQRNTNYLNLILKIIFLNLNLRFYIFMFNFWGINIFYKPSPLIVKKI